MTPLNLVVRAVAYWLLLVAAVLLALPGCGASDSALQQIQREYGSDPELLPYISAFRREMHARGLPWGGTPRQLLWRNLDADDAIGLCILPYRYVYIHPRLRDRGDGTWRGAGLRRAVVYHELAHCMYEAPHEYAPGHILSEELGFEIDDWSPADWDYELDRLAAWILVASGDEDVRVGAGLHR